MPITVYFGYLILVVTFSPTLHEMVTTLHFHCNAFSLIGVTLLLYTSVELLGKSITYIKAGFTK